MVRHPRVHRLHARPVHETHARSGQCCFEEVSLGAEPQRRDRDEGRREFHAVARRHNTHSSLCDRDQDSRGRATVGYGHPSGPVSHCTYVPIGIHRRNGLVCRCKRQSRAGDGAAQSIDAGARYLRQQLDTFGGDARKALAAYNAGPGAVQRYGGVPPYGETQNYVQKVMAYADEYRRGGSSATAMQAAAQSSPLSYSTT